MLVRATDEFMKKGIKPKELKRIPKAGTEFEIEDSRFELLFGDNKYKAKFVEKVEDEVPEVTANENEDLNTDKVETTEEVETKSEDDEIETKEVTGETKTEEEVKETTKTTKAKGKAKSEEDK